MLKIYNSLTRKKEEFIPIHEGEVRMYGCGVTPYKPSHLGHAMQGVIFDVIRRYFEFSGYKVTYVRNYTDIEDRIIEIAKEKGMSALDYSQSIINQCEEDFENLKVRQPDFSTKVSEFIPQIIKAIKILIEKGNAYYTKHGNVYFSVKTFPEYGKLSGRKTDELKEGVRKKSKNDKKDPFDFALWKSAENEISLEDNNGQTVFWDSPWGKGRPGWHIECSVMSAFHLGNHFDIHGGGLDLIFPHHENEIAQSESMNNGKFVNYWVHNGLLMVGEKKMSKSLKNDILIKDWLKKYHPEIIRYLILTNHYRSHVTFKPERYVDATKRVYKIYQTLEKVQNIDGKINSDLYEDLMNSFKKSMDNDFNTVEVIAKINTIIKQIDLMLSAGNIEKDEFSEIITYVEYIKSVGEVIGLFVEDPKYVIEKIEDFHLEKQKISREEIGRQVGEWRNYREAKDYDDADKIRKSLQKRGVMLTNNSPYYEILIN